MAQTRGNIGGTGQGLSSTRGGRESCSRSMTTPLLQPETKDLELVLGDISMVMRVFARLRFGISCCCWNSYLSRVYRLFFFNICVQLVRFRGVNHCSSVFFVFLWPRNTYELWSLLFLKASCWRATCILNYLYYSSYAASICLNLWLVATRAAFALWTSELASLSCTTSRIIWSACPSSSTSSIGILILSSFFGF